MQALTHFMLKAIFSFGLFAFCRIIDYYYWIEYCPSFICDPYKNVADEYDYVVVGAGSAGSVVALRLAEDSKARILLVEAGSTGGAFLDVPAVLPFLQLSKLDWMYHSVPQENAFGAMKDKVVKYPRGKLVGGTGRLNNMIYARGDPKTYGKWYENRTDYDYDEDILRYFLKSENQIGRFKEDAKYHSRDGPMFVEDIVFETELADAVLEAAEFLKIPVRDVNGEHASGFMKPQLNLRNGARYSTGHFLLENQPENLQLLTHSQVLKINFKYNFEATGVELSRFSVVKNIKAKHAVVLCAGTIDSAKLLMLSGIGEADHLKDIGIEPLVDLPVGQNFQDHYTTALDLVTVDRPLRLTPFSTLSPLTLFDYLFRGKGALTTAQCDVMGFLHTNCIDLHGYKDFDECIANQTDLNLQFMMIPLGFVSDSGAHLRHIAGVTDMIWDEYLVDLLGTPTMGLLPILLNSKSRGIVRLSDKNPFSKPLIDPKALTDQYDVDVLVNGIYMLKKLLETPSMKTLGAKLYTKPLPGCESHEFDSRAYWECYVRHITISVYHPVGTARMGHPDDPRSVVDYDFKVLKTNKLYVADASVMPYISSANTNAAVVLIAEKAADAVRKNQMLCEGESDVCDILYTPKGRNK